MTNASDTHTATGLTNAFRAAHEAGDYALNRLHSLVFLAQQTRMICLGQ